MSDAAPEDGGLFEEQRRIYELLSQETRHLILQHVLGHPSHLPSLDELAFMLPKNKAAIRDQLHVLADAGILQRYEHPPSEGARDLPSQFYGLTEYGVDVLHEYNYLRGLPVARAVYDNTRLSEKAQRHRDAPRPELPEAVATALAIDDAEESVNADRLARYVRERKAETHSVDEQVDVAKAFFDAGIGPNHEGIERTDLLEELDVEIEYRPRTVLKHLVDIGILAETMPPGPNALAISERADEIVDGQVTEEAEANVEALVAHVDDELQPGRLTAEASEPGQDAAPAPSVARTDGAGRTIRAILATAFGVAPEHVTDVLRSGDPVDRLDEAVEAIESAEEVSRSGEDGRIVFVQPAYRYRLTERAEELLTGS